MVRFYAVPLGVVALWYGILPAAATCEERNVKPLDQAENLDFESSL